MVHYSLFRFKENMLTDSVINGFAEKLASLEKKYEGIVNPQIYRNIVSREHNMDLMFTLEMESLDDLKRYLESEEHAQLQEQYGDLVESQFSFDHN